MSGSEDGQLKSPGEEPYMSGNEEHDGDSLDIKPPQANVSHPRDPTGSRRKEKSSKEKKHSKEKRHRERNELERRERVERDSRGGGGSSGGEQQRRSGDIERREHRRDERNEMIERYPQRSGPVGSGGVYERDEMSSNSDRRYQKHYERPNDGGVRGGVSGGNHGYHHHHQQQQQQQHQYHQTHMNMQRSRQQEYYERGQSYHHGGGAAEYHSNRHQQYIAKHGGSNSGGGGHLDYGGHHEIGIEMQRDRRKYVYEQPKDAESLEQDLRSRLLSKRHKYVRGANEPEEQQYEMRGAVERRVDVSDRAAKAERHKIHRGKDRVESVIEVLDSPEAVETEFEVHHKRKHKRRNKEREDAEVLLERRKTPDDPELLARRAKILAAEKEKEQRKESAREELEARREMRRERSTTVNDALSPTAVAASVTAGLNVVVKRKKQHDVEEAAAHSKRKRMKKLAKERSDYEGDDDYDGEVSDTENDESEESLSDSESVDSSAESEKSYTKSKSRVKLKKRENNRDADDDDDVEDHSEGELELPESPLSIGELSKSPKHNKHKKKKTKKHSDDEERSSHSRSRSPISERSHTRSLSRSRSNSRSPSRSSHRSRSRSRTRSHSESLSATSRSRSRSPRSQTRSRSGSHRSRSRSRSRTRSEERDMATHQQKADAEEKDTDVVKKKTFGGDSDEVVLFDDKGLPLPNYFPGIQGCRSVEEFQCLNRIEEGTYGVVYRAKDKRTSEIVALKRLKMEKEKEGFPITSLREINTLLKGQHPNIVTVREIVVGSNMDKIFIVMDYVEHDLKSLMETMKTRKQSFFPGEVKCLTQQLLLAVGHLHDNWILHRDLKTSNLLLSHKGILKVGDFGLAREYGSPLKKYTSIVVTLWYRAPELLLCSPEYSTPIDIWSVGCIFAEFLQMAPLFPGKSEIDELNRIFKELGTPNEKIWPGYKDLPAVKNLLSQNSQFTEYPVSNLRKHFNDKASESGVSLLQGLLTYDPKQRLNADAALKHPYFKELPLPIDPSMFPTWPAKSELGARKALASSPKPPSGGSQFKQLGRDDIVMAGGGNSKVVSGIITGNKKTASNTGFVLNAGIDQRQLAMGPGFNLKF